MKNKRIAVNSIASLFKTIRFGAKSGRQITNRIFDALIAVALIAVLALAGTVANAQSTLTGENSAELQRLLAVPAESVPVPYSNRKPPRTPASAFDRLLMWNEIALDTTAIDHTPPAPGEDTRRFGEQLGPHRSSYAMAMIHIAMFDAENAITKKFVSYTGIPSVSGNVSLDRAQSAHDTLVALYPFQKERLDIHFRRNVSTRFLPWTLVSIPGSQPSIDAGAALGTQAANAILALRANDGSALPEPRWFVDYFPIGYPNVQPGIWQVDPVSILQVALGANWPKVKPFVMTSPDQFRVPPPPSLTSDFYKAAFREVFLLGGDPDPPDPAFRTNTARTARQTFIGKFWGYDGTPGLCAPPRLYNMVAKTIALQQHMLTVPDMARLLALVNVALADAGIAAWDSKYKYQYWRPVTGIRNAVLPLPAVPLWYPLGAPATNTAGKNFTPPFPGYPSGHATFGGALFQMLRKFFIPTQFTFISDEWNGKNKDSKGFIRPLQPETFASFSQAEFENAQSRVYLGIHWQFDADVGINKAMW